MTARRPAAAAGWATVIGGGATVIATVAGRRAQRLGEAAVAAQAIVPWSALASWPVAAIAALGRRPRNVLAMAGAAVGTAGVVIAARMAGQPAPNRRSTGADGETLSIAHVNLLYLNDVLDLGVAVLRGLRADVLTFSEYTPAHAEVLAPALAEHYPYRIERAGPYAHGMALWSRFPVADLRATALTHERITADVTAPAGTVRVMVVHTISPPNKVAEWRAEMALLAAEAQATDRPAVMIGDFNASWNHPDLRAIAAGGWRSAHRDRGRGLSPSWPADRWYPAFMRIDHALVSGRVNVVDVMDFTLPGSDHRGLVVTLSPAQ